MALLLDINVSKDGKFVNTSGCKLEILEWDFGFEKQIVYGSIMVILIMAFYLY